MGDTQHAENPFKLSAPVADSLKTVSAIQLQKADIPPLRFIVDQMQKLNQTNPQIAV